jgi:hypothetical protein
MVTLSNHGLTYQENPALGARYRVALIIAKEEKAAYHRRNTGESICHGNGRPDMW